MVMKSTRKIKGTLFYTHDKTSKLYTLIEHPLASRPFTTFRPAKIGESAELRIDLLVGDEYHRFTLDTTTKKVNEELKKLERETGSLTTGTIVLADEAQIYLMYGDIKNPANQKELSKWALDTTQPKVRPVSVYDFRGQNKPNMFGYHPGLIAEATDKTIHRLIAIHHPDFNGPTTIGNVKNLASILDKAFYEN